MLGGTEKTTHHSLQIGLILHLRASIDLLLVEGVELEVEALLSFSFSLSLSSLFLSALWFHLDPS